MKAAVRTFAKPRNRLYVNQVVWIALNDETLETDVDTLAELISVCLVSDTHSIDAHRVAEDVWAYRQEFDYQKTRVAQDR